MDTGRSMRRPGTSSGLNRTRGHDSEDISFMVNKLNDILKLQLTLVSFDEMTHNQQLLPLFQQVLVYLSPEQRVDLSKESPEETVRRITHFLANILNMRYVKQIPPQELVDGIIKGERKILYPILFQILDRVEELKTKVYLAKYLMEVKVPNDMFSFDDIAEVYNQYKRSLEQFKQTHQITYDLRQKVSSPEDLKNEIMGQEKEREQLIVKIDDLKKKISDSTTDPTKIIEVTRLLRKEVEAEEKLGQSERDQRTKLAAANELLAETQLKLEETERTVGEGDITAQVSKLEAQVQEYQIMCQNQLPASIDQMRTQIETLRRVKNLTSITDSFNNLESDIRRLKEEISILQDKLNEKEQQQNQTDAGDDRMASFSKMMATKKRDLQKKLDFYIKESKKMDDKKAELEGELKAFEGQKIPTKEEFEKYKHEIMNTANRCREMKQELASIKNETAILKRTEDILKSRDTRIEELVQELEKKHGVSGFRDIQKNLEDVSLAKGTIDEMKGQTLEQISKVVQEINDQINSKKTLYKPKVAKLRESRQELQNLEQEHMEKKALYENAKLKFESERNKILEDLSEYQSELESSESVYHLIHSQLLINKMAKERADDEREYRSGTKTLNAHYSSHQSILNHELTQLEEASKQLRERQREIKENYEPAQKQITLFTNLKKLLECKIQLKDQQAMLHSGPALSSNINSMGLLGMSHGSSAGMMMRPQTGKRPNPVDHLILEH